MRGDDRRQAAMFRYISPEARVPRDHPLRAIRGLVAEALAELSPRFGALYGQEGRPSILPEKLLRAQLFRWFVGLDMDDPVWDATVFTKNRQRLLDGEIAGAFLERIVLQARQRGLLSGEHFTVDGTLIEAWASLKSFKRRHTAAPPPDDPGAGRGQRL